jgi:hypothetical protein
MLLHLLLFSSVPAVPAVNKIVSTAPDLQPKQPSTEDSLLLGDSEEMETGVQGEEEPKKSEEGEAADSESDDDDDDVQITIGDIATAPGVGSGGGGGGGSGSGYTRTPSYSRIGTTTGSSGTGGNVLVMHAKSQ